MNMHTHRILFMAPAQTVTRIFPQLKDAGFEVGIAENVKGASSFIRKGLPCLILSRPSLPGYNVEDLLSLGQEDTEFPPVIVFSDKATPEEAQQMMELGAKDYWIEPVTFEKVQAAVPRKAPSPVSVSTTLGGRKPECTAIIGESPTMARALSLAKQVARSKATVLISGESGTGKEVFSRFLHEQSDRAGNPFVAVNCAALPEHLLESELFGHEKGAFTGAVSRKYGKFEMANEGTLLLDEISEMELGLQAKLLRVLQESEIDRVGGSETVKVNVRVLATTNRDLEAWVAEGRFRSDLYFRLNVIPLRLPSLAERGEDILQLARFFLGRYSKEYQLPPTSLTAQATEWLMSYTWPGNVRELQNMMERAALLCGGHPVVPGHFLLEGDDWPLFCENSDAETKFSQSDSFGAEADAGREACAEVDFFHTVSGTDLVPPSVSGQRIFTDGVIPLHEMERIMIQKGLEHTRGNRTQAADLLGISVRTLRNKLNEYRLAGLHVE